MAALTVTPLRPCVITQTDIHQLAERLASRGVALAPDAPTLAGDLQAGARAICGLIDQLGKAAGPGEAAHLVAGINVGEA
jgi:hypothetical protein